ncbi:MAG TPA: YitT family protein [Bacillaceae bacterium]|nr:YitT family protein [Paenibacillus bovis]HLU23521.1 YitT family protein [Bacillaceae bacterium]
MKVKPNTTKITHQKLSKKEIVGRIFIVTIGALIMAISLEVFLIPNNILDGGITGIAIIISHLTGLKVGILLFVLNLPFIFVGYKQIGKTFALTTLYGIIVLSSSSLFLHHHYIVTHDLLLATVFGGIILGIGVGLVIRYGGSLDGTEIISILINNKLPLSVGEVILFFNFFIFSTAGFVFSWERAMYSILTYFIASKFIDIIVSGLNESKSAWIISDNPEKIADAILARLGRSVTVLNGLNPYSGEDKQVVFCVITRLEEKKLKSILNELDANAFLAVGSISEAQGGRFKKKGIH